MKIDQVEFNFKYDSESEPFGYQEITCHTVFDVNMYFTRNKCFVEGVHCTKPPESDTYASMVSRDSVISSIIISDFNDIGILSAYIQVE